MLQLDETTIATALLILSVLSSCFLGCVVLAQNPGKRTHQAFALLTLNIALWAVGVLVIIHCHTQETAQLWLRITFAIAAFLPASFYQFIALFPYQRYHGSRLWQILLYCGAVGLAFSVNTPWYILHVEVFPGAPPLAQYGLVFPLYFLMVVSTMILMSINLFRKLRDSIGIQHRQIQHVVVFIFMSIVFAVATNVVAPIFDIGTMEKFGPCFMVLMMAGLAYSMVRYHLLDIWGIMSRTTLYAVVTSFVVVAFMGSVSLVHWAVKSTGPTRDLLTTAIAAIIIVLVIQPLKERIQLFLDRIVVHRRYDADALLERISRYSARIVQLDSLLERVGKDVEYTLGAQQIRILLLSEKEPATLVTEYSSKAEEKKFRDTNRDFLVHFVESNPEPLLLEELIHGRPSPDRVRVAQHLAEMEVYLLLPLKTKLNLVGFICLGQKSSRDIYTREDIRVCASFVGPLATTIENARLYARLEELNLHLERIMSSMRGGVVAVDALGTITTVNDEARRILGEVHPGQALEVLEPQIRSLLKRTLNEGRGIRDFETEIQDANGELISVALSSSFFATKDPDHDGAMVLVYNMTEIKRLQSNVQRADRLMSIGTMAAGMAHEIKNPLQSIKTFTQLLPSRFHDPDFRKTFSEVVPPEVQRIDTIVSRLLDFARPKPVCFAPQNLQIIIEDVLALIENQIKKGSITVIRSYPGEMLDIMADDQQMHQVFLNLLLNAIDAMVNSRERYLHIRIFFERCHLTQGKKEPRIDIPCIKVVIADTGRGVLEQHLKQVFTPFFTTKDHGSGLGLAVVHGIVAEHGGEIDVSSVPGVETAFSLVFPLAEAEQGAERIPT